VDTVEKFMSLCTELGGSLDGSVGEVTCRVEPKTLLGILGRIRELAEEHVRSEGYATALTIGDEIVHIVIRPDGVELHFDLEVYVETDYSEEDLGKACEAAYNAVTDAILKSTHPAYMPELVDFADLDVRDCHDYQQDAGAVVICDIRTGALPPKEMWRIEKLLKAVLPSLNTVIEAMKSALEKKRGGGVNA